MVDNQTMKYFIYIIPAILYIIYLISDYILPAAIIFFSLFLIVGLIAARYYILSLRESYLIKREERFKASREIITTGDQVFVRETDSHSTWKPLHLFANQYINGKPTEPSQLELQAYYNWHKRKNVKNELPMIIEGNTQKQHTIFDVVNTGVHFSLIGSTNSGKTTLANHIIEYINADKSYAIDPHAKFNVWSSQCQIVQSYDDIEYTLQQAFVEMTSRYDNGPDDYETILLAIDEWPAIIAERSNCENYISRISREGRKVDIRLLLLSQSDQIGEIGLSMALRNNFIKIELVPELTKKNQGSIKHWDKSTEIIELAGPYNTQGKFYQQTKKDLAAALRAANPNLSDSQLAKTVYGSDGGRQLELVRGVR